MTHFFERKPGGLVYCLSAAMAIFGFVALAQQMSNTVVKDFSVPESFDPPHEKQLKSLLQGAEAEPQSGGLILIRRLKLQSFTETGETQMVVLAPQCVFDTTQHTVNSAGHLDARSGDGRLFIEGEGFLFQQTNLNLIISNRVHTIIRNTPQKTPQQ
jgi:hypothetical protein